MKAAPGLMLALLLAIPVRAGSIALDADRKVFLMGEPVYLSMESANGRPPALEEGSVILAISTPDSGEFLYQPPMRFRIRPESPGTRKREPRFRFARLIAHRDGLLFRKAGRYHLRLVAPLPSPAADANESPGEGFRVLSDTFALEIGEPASSADLRAFTTVSRDPAEYAMAVYLEGGGHLKKGMAIIRVLAGFPNYLKPTASFVLSSDWSQDYIAPDGTGSRSLDLEKALSFAQWDRVSGTYLALRNAYRLRNGLEILARREPDAASLETVRRRLEAFESSLSPGERFRYDSLR